MKCFAITAQGTHCSRQVVSGNTLDLDGHIVRLCNQHYKNTVSIAQVWTSEPKFINNVQEDTMYTDTYDQDNSFDIALAQLEGQPYTVSNTPVAGKFLIENCQHEWCIESHNETMWEVHNEVCCGVADCEHYTAMLCLTHIPNINHTSKEDIMNTIINNNEVMENNLPTSPVTGSSDRGDKWIKCVKCSKEIGSDWYHANVADMRTCMGAAPAPVKAKTSVRGGFEVDVMNGMSVRGDYTWFFDSSREVVKAKYMELQAAGRNPFPMKKTSKGDWQVAFRTIQS